MLHLPWFGWDENWWGRRKDFQYLVLGPTFLLYYLNSKCFFSIFFVSIPFHKTKPYLNVWFCGCVALVTRPVPFSCFGVLKKEKHVLLHSIADVVIEQGDDICSFLMCCSLDGFFYRTTPSLSKICLIYTSLRIFFPNYTCFKLFTEVGIWHPDFPSSFFFINKFIYY